MITKCIVYNIKNVTGLNKKIFLSDSGGSKLCCVINIDDNIQSLCDDIPLMLGCLIVILKFNDGTIIITGIINRYVIDIIKNEIDNIRALIFSDYISQNYYSDGLHDVYNNKIGKYDINDMCKYEDLFKFIPLMKKLKYLHVIEYNMLNYNIENEIYNLLVYNDCDHIQIENTGLSEEFLIKLLSENKLNIINIHKEYNVMKILNLLKFFNTSVKNVHIYFKSVEKTIVIVKEIYNIINISVNPILFEFIRNDGETCVKDELYIVAVNRELKKFISDRKFPSKVFSFGEVLDYDVMLGFDF